MSHNDFENQGWFNLIHCWTPHGLFQGDIHYPVGRNNPFISFVTFPTNANMDPSSSPLVTNFSPLRVFLASRSLCTELPQGWVGVPSQSPSLLPPSHLLFSSLPSILARLGYRPDLFSQFAFPASFLC